MDEKTDKRRKNGVSWKMITSTSVIAGFTIDNLNTKSLAQATSDFERLFVSIRKVLEKNGAYCMDVEEERLQVCQDLAKKVSQNYKQIFKEKM